MLSLMACGDLYTGEDLPPLNPDEVVDPDDPTDPDWGQDHEDLVPVQVTYTDPSYTVLSRGLGAFEEPLEDENGFQLNTGKRNWERAITHIYAFSTDPTTDYSITRKQDTDRLNTLVDGSVDLYYWDGIVENVGNSTEKRIPLGYNLNEGHGKRAYFTNKDGGTFFQWDEGTEDLYYSTLQQLTPFKFHAYHIGRRQITSSGESKLVSNFSRTADEVAFDLELDGTQDVIYGESNTEMGEIEKKVEANYPITSDMDPDEVAEAEANRKKLRESLFSTYSAHRNVHPFIQFHHKLCYLKFEIYPGGNYTDMKQKKDSIYVQEVRIRSKNKGRFIIASKEEGKSGTLTLNEVTQTQDGLQINHTDNTKREYYNLVLTDTLLQYTDKNGHTIGDGINQQILARDSFIVTLKDEYFDKEQSVVSTYNREGKRLGESGILCAPANSIPLFMTLYQCFEDKKPQEYNIKYDIKLSDGKRFEAGNYYTIRIAIFGLYDIEVEAQMDGWSNGGNVNLEPDNDWGN